MTAILLWGMAALAGLLLAALALPVRLRIIAGTRPAPRLRLRLSLLGGLVPPIPVVDSARRASPTADRHPSRRRRARPRRRAGIRRLRGVPDLLGAGLQAFRLRHLRLDADFGLGDPAETGIAYGLLAPLLHSGALDPDAVALRPDFTRQRLSGEIDAEIGLVPARLLPPIARFALRNARR